jgi:hypothetical protein
MPLAGLAKFNPFVLGQITLLLGVSAVVVLMIPLMKSHPYFQDSAVENKRTSDSGAEINRFHGYAMPVALIGLGLGIIGLRREKPPLLPICGITLCGFVLCWNYIVIGFSYLSLAVLALVVILTVLDPIFLLLNILARSKN